MVFGAIGKYFGVSITYPTITLLKDEHQIEDCQPECKRRNLLFLFDFGDGRPKPESCFLPGRLV